MLELEVRLIYFFRLKLQKKKLKRLIVIHTNKILVGFYKKNYLNDN